MKKLIIIEITAVAFVLILLVTLVNFSVYLNPSNQDDRIDLYVEKEYAAGNITVVPGERAFVQFSYLSYEPAMLILELTFQSWELTGYLDIRCNNKPIQPVFASPENPNVSLNLVSASGAEWVEPLSSMFGLNEVTFDSRVEGGFKGLVSYRIMLRGIR